MTPAPAPLYGQASLADLTPSILAALGVPARENVLGVPEAQRVALLVIDGLGWELLRAAPEHAPFLSGLAAAGRSLTTGFPSTTAASVASIGTGLPPGEHGLLGYTMVLPGHSRAMNVLRWNVYGAAHATDLLHKIPPEQLQPRPTALEDGAAAGVEILLIAPNTHEHSGLSRAALRGGRFRTAFSPGDLVAGILDGLRSGPRMLVYGHHNDLDSTGHARGSRSSAWAYTLRQVDRMCQSVAEGLPQGSALVITGDHGMVDLQDGERLELDHDRDLAAGVRLMAGEGRARYLYTEHGACEDVVAAWRTKLGDRMWIVERDEAIAAGWFGPRVLDDVRRRIGDVIAAAHAPVGIFQRAIDSGQANLLGHHGSLTPAEQLVPFLVVQA
ncbi:MAG: alkaline phosphatase family protein [Chloroflexi bacterium]|nr:alkaline phosphatase family protein [Chloroflexota bacterium]